MKKIYLLAFLISSLSSFAQEFGTNDLRISDMGTDGVTSFFAFEPRAAYSTTEDKYLIVWAADDNRGSIVDNEFEIYGQFINSDGLEVGSNDFRISFLGTDGDTNFRAEEADVVWNSVNNEFLVVWKGETAVDGELEIFGQRINANSGALIGSNFRISDVGSEGDTARAATRPKVAYSATSNEYLVVWEADDESLNNEIEIYGQRISNTGTEVGNNDFKISNQLPVNDGNFDARYPSLAWNSLGNEFLIVWQGETSTDDESEVYGQIYDADTNTLSGSDFRISDMGTDASTSFSIGQVVRVAYNNNDDEYLVVWNGSDLVANQYEIFGQRVSAAGVELGTNDFRISNLTSENSNFDAWAPDIVHNNNLNEYLVIYRGDANSTVNEEEIYGQKLTNLGVSNGSAFLLSDMGPSSNTDYTAGEPALATNNQDSYLISWQGDDNIAPNDGETEIFIQMYGNPSLNLEDINTLRELSLYPNPADDKIYFKLNTNIQLEVQIWNTLGQLKKSVKVNAMESINIIDLISGIYFITVKYGDSRNNFKLIKN